MKRRAMSWASALVVALSCVGAACAGAVVAKRVIYGGSSPPSEPKRKLPKHTETVAFLVGASWCNGSHEPALRRAMNRLDSALKSQANTAGTTSSTIGVALDWSIGDGLNWLRSVHDFDEVSVGNDWWNSVALGVLWTDSTARHALPQLIVVRRRIDVTALGVSLGADTVIARVVGGKSIAKWVDEYVRH